MKTSAIICEYNPFHNGHKFQIDAARTLTECDAVVALMSGNFAQRGDFTLFPKQVRAKAALNCGVDLVLENHTTSVLRSAEGYASSAVFTLSALGCIDYLVFGAENDDIEKLTEIALLLTSEDKFFKKFLKEEIAKGISFAKARSNAVNKILGNNAAEILSKPNNILGIEYIKAIITQNSVLKPVAIKRTGAGHNSTTPFGEIASASYIRDNFSDEIIKYIPEAAALEFTNSSYFKSNSADKAILAHLSLSTTNEIAKAPDISEGLENKIKSETLTSSTLTQLILSVKSKRYAYSRIRRAILCSYLKIDKNDTIRSPEYIKILDFNKTGQRILNIAKKTCTLPLAKNASAIIRSNSAMELWKRELEFDKVYNLFL